MKCEDLRKIMDVSEGKLEGDIVIKNVNHVNVVTKEIERSDIVICGDTIASVRLSKEDSNHVGKIIIDGEGKYLIPGLIDAHTHIEMSFLSPSAFAEAVLEQGTTGAVLDMHDICNVSIEAMEHLAKEISTTELKSYLMIPPCVPATPELEDAGGIMKLDDLMKATKLPNIKGIGETMDFNRVLNRESEIISMLSWAKENGYRIDGHCPELRGDSLQAYISAGITSDHESGSIDEMMEKYRLGMKIILRRGSIAEPVRAGDFVDLLKDTSNVMLATDGCIYLDDILNKGHMIYALRQIISEGVDPITAIQMATINVARAYGMEHRVGLIGPGRCADMILVDNLEDLNVLSVIANGKIFKSDEGKEINNYEYPNSVLNSVNISNVSIKDFEILSPSQEDEVVVRIIGVNGKEVVTKEIHEKMNPIDGKIYSDTNRDILKVAVFDRYHGDGKRTVGLVRGFGLKEGAFGGTIGQDSQNLIVVGANENDMLKVVEALKEQQGGIAVVNNGEIISSIRLPIGGIMSQLNPWKLNNEFKELNVKLRNMGCEMDNPSFALSLMITCAVIPELKMTNQGLVDANKGEFISMFVK